MRNGIGRIGRTAFAVGLLVSLSFGFQQAVSSQPRTLCEGTCPSEKLCRACCIEAGGSDGECWGPPLYEDCICIA